MGIGLDLMAQRQEQNKCGPGDDKCDMDGVCEKHAKEYEKSVFQPAMPTMPAPKQEKRKRVSNGLYQLAQDASKLEEDFQYQYDYAQELMEKLAKSKSENATLEGKVKDLAGYLKDAVEQKDAYATEVRQLRYSAPTPPFWKWLTFIGWTLALLAGGVIATEKISGQPIDKLVNDVIISLHEQAN